MCNGMITQNWLKEASVDNNAETHSVFTRMFSISSLLVFPQKEWFSAVTARKSPESKERKPLNRLIHFVCFQLSSYKTTNGLQLLQIVGKRYKHENIQFFTIENLRLYNSALSGKNCFGGLRTSNNAAITTALPAGHRSIPDLGKRRHRARGMRSHSFGFQCRHSQLVKTRRHCSF